jgi:monoamine oxidase
LQAVILAVTVDDTSTGAKVQVTKTYSYLITTCTTPALQIMDLREAQLKYSHREAIRVLRCDNSVKVGIKFKYRWWADDNGIIRGGLGKTHRPTRVIVYPSYVLNTPRGHEGVLLACYNWAQDAACLGTYCDEEIVSLVIADLPIMHNKTESDLRDAPDCYHVHDWNRDPRTGGAFGLFGPGQFATLFPKIQRLTADGRLIFAGELTSIYHGWIVASLNSSFRAVHQMLLTQWGKSTPEEKDYIACLIWKLLENWGGDDHEPTAGAEYDTYPQGTAGWQVFLGTRKADI